MTLTINPSTSRGPSLLLDLKELSRLLARSPAALIRDAHAGRIPRPLKLGRSTRWRRSEIQKWLDLGCPNTAPC